jgi:hypothetical protein
MQAKGAATFNSSVQQIPGHPPNEGILDANFLSGDAAESMTNSSAKTKTKLQKVLLASGLVVLFFFLYVAGVLVSVMSLTAVPPAADALSLVGAQALAIERGFKFDAVDRFRTEHCLAERAVCMPDMQGRFSAEDVIKSAGDQLITPVAGKAACSPLLLEPLWRQPCIVISIPQQIRIGAMTPSEVEKVLAAIRAPCRMSGISAKTTSSILGCENGQLRRPIRAVVFVSGKKETIHIQ